MLTVQSYAAEMERRLRWQLHQPEQGHQLEGTIDQTGNTLARTMLVEAEWSFRHSYLKRAAHLPQEVKGILQSSGKDVIQEALYNFQSVHLGLCPCVLTMPHAQTHRSGE